jgi:hypothetical protein
VAELGVHAAHAETSDAFSKGVSVMVAIIGVVLAVVTIFSHRAHTASVIHRTEANDQWTLYEAKKIHEQMLDIALNMSTALAATDSKQARDLTERYVSERDRYDREAKDIQREAQSREVESEHEEERALRFDIGDGFLELGLVLSSLYFLSKRRFFPAMGAAAAVIGAAISVVHWFV